MPLGEHERTNKGRFRKERRDSRVGNLQEDYPELDRFNGNTHLGTLLDEYDVDSLSQLLKKLRK
jgi:hypothetical protein